jgi:hypothetical protein
VTVRRADPEGRQPDGERPFVGEDRSASLGQLQSMVTGGFLASHWISVATKQDVPGLLA